MSDDEPSDIELAAVFEEELRKPALCAIFAARRALFNAGRSFERERGAAWKAAPDVHGLWLLLRPGCKPQAFQLEIISGVDEPGDSWFGPIPADPKDPK